MYPLLIDVSHHQGVMDWNKAVSAGARAAIIRAGSIDNGSGVPYTDHQYTNNLAAFDLLPLASYWYWRPNHDTLRQVNHWANLVRGKPFWKLWVDVEDAGGMTQNVVSDRLVWFLAKLREAVPGVPIGIYTSAVKWNAYTVTRPEFGALDLWVARYNSLVKHPWDTSTTLRPRDWQDWKLWQWSADGNGRGAEFGAKSGAIDINYFNGDEAALRAYCGLAPAATPAPTAHDHADLRTLIAEQRQQIASLVKIQADQAGAIAALQTRLGRAETALEQHRQHTSTALGSAAAVVTEISDRGLATEKIAIDNRRRLDAAKAAL